MKVWLALLFLAGAVSATVVLNGAIFRQDAPTGAYYVLGQSNPLLANAILTSGLTVNLIPRVDVNGTLTLGNASNYWLGVYAINGYLPFLWSRNVSAENLSASDSLCLRGVCIDNFTQAGNSTNGVNASIWNTLVNGTNQLWWNESYTGAAVTPATSSSAEAFVPAKDFNATGLFALLVAGSVSDAIATLSIQTDDGAGRPSGTKLAELNVTVSHLDYLQGHWFGGQITPTSLQVGVTYFLVVENATANPVTSLYINSDVRPNSYYCYYTAGTTPPWNKALGADMPFVVAGDIPSLWFGANETRFMLDFYRAELIASDAVLAGLIATNTADIITGQTNDSVQSGQILDLNATKAKTGNCSAGQFVQNDTIWGPYCATPSTGGFSVWNRSSTTLYPANSGDGVYLNGSGSNFTVSGNGSFYGDAFNVTGNCSLSNDTSQFPALQTFNSGKTRVSTNYPGSAGVAFVENFGLTPQAWLYLGNDNKAIQVYGYRCLSATGLLSGCSALLAGTQLINFEAKGYGATGWSSAGRTGFAFTAAENWNDTAQGADAGITSTPLGTTNTRRVINATASGAINMPYQSGFRAYNSSAASLSATIKRFDFDTESWDTQSEYSNPRFTAKEPGIYHATAKIACSTSTNSVAFNITKNAVTNSTAVSTRGGEEHSDDFQLAVGDYLEVYASAAAPSTCESGYGYTYFEVHKVA